MENIVKNTVDESLLNEFASLNAPEEEEYVNDTPKEQVQPKQETQPATVETKGEEVLASKEERANPRLLRLNNELKKQLEEANSRIARYEDGDYEADQEVELSRQYVKDIAKKENLDYQARSLDDQETNDFYSQHPDANEFRLDIEKLATENPSLSLEFIYR